MNKDFSELIKYLDKKFRETAKKEDLTKLVTLDEFDGFKKEIRNEMSKLRKSIQTLTDSVDKLVKSFEEYHDEQIALTGKIDRLEKWINQVAKHVGVELKS